VNILFVKIGALGDAVMARSLAAAAQEGDHVTWVAGRGIAALVRQFEGVHEVIEVDDAALLQGGFFARLGAVLSLWKKLAGRRFDLVLTGHGDWRYRLLSLPVFAGQRRHFQPRPGRWHGDEYARLLHGIDGPLAARPFLNPLQPKLGAALAAQAVDPEKSVLLFPGGAKNLLRDDHLRRWPLQNYGALAKALRGEGYSVWLGGSAGDAWVRPAFEGLGCVDLIGATSLAETLALCARAARVVAHDSGPLHLAQLARTPTVALFGPTIPEEKIDPGAPVRVLWGGEELPCRPCYDGKDYAPCPAPACLAVVQVSDVMEALTHA
jgi:heptosyltransferase-2